MSKYIPPPPTISYNDIIERNFSLSSSQYKNFTIKNKNCLLVKDFLIRDLVRKDLGVEVGSINYIDQSTHYFLRTKALQSHSYIPEISKETILPIIPNSFVNMSLKEKDLIISKDGNIGEIVILDNNYPNTMLSSALYKLPVIKYKYYLLAMIKHNIFREQLDFITPKGSTIRHAKTLFLDCKIPMPNDNVDNVIKFIEYLTQAIINKQKLIKERHKVILEILELIEKELLDNQKHNIFSFNLPNIKEIQSVGRLDAGIYSQQFKEIIFIIQNYIHNTKNIYELNFSLSRGQNLQEKHIGKSVYSPTYHNNFYKLILPKFISKYGTISKVEFLGNPNNLKVLEKGDLIFGAEGFEKGRSVVIIEDNIKSITNIHGVTIKNGNNDIYASIFIKCMLDYYRNLGLIDLYAVGSNGGSLALKYWDAIPFPNFPIFKQQEIAQLYHNPINYDLKNANLDNFLALDDGFNSHAGIYELDKSAKQLQFLLDKAIENIIHDKSVEISFV